MWIAVGVFQNLLLGLFGDGGDVFRFFYRKVEEDPFQQPAAKPFVGMQKHKVVDGEDGPVLGQCQYGVMHITCDVKEPFFEAGQKNKVEENRENASAGKRQFYFFNFIKTGSC